jgi:tRNA1Val (adenine37-N6)-methyltransferase
MANTFFQFKKFIVHQEHSAMKVCTDACLFGAWVAKDEAIISANNILDIGTGTGLLSLMLAQATAINSNAAKITAIEIETAAATEAASNFALSAWTENMHVVNSSLQDYSASIKNGESTIPKFDCIITNPPFYEGDLKSPDPKKNLASHSAGLPWSELTEHASALLKEGGSYFVLIPALRSYTMQKLSEANGLQLVEEVLVHNTAKTLPIRAMQKFIKPIGDIKSQASIMVKRSKIFIKDADNKYEAAFTELLQEYYLHL